MRTTIDGGPIAAAARRLSSGGPPLPPERLCGIHNPWGYPVEGIDPWAFLALCEADPFVDCVAELIGPDVILWDCELHLHARAYRTFLQDGREGRYWPVEPLAGAVALIGDAGLLAVRRLAEVTAGAIAESAADEPLLVIRYMPASSRFIRDPEFPANRLDMEERLLINYAMRPLWLLRGEDRAGNDFTCGFAPPIPRWANARGG